MPNIDTRRAEALAAAIVRRQGAADEVAADVAAHLVLAERSGHASHGLSILPGYLAAVAAGTLDPAAAPEQVRDDGAFVGFDGHRGYGQHVGRVAVAAGIQRAQDLGSCFLTVRNSYHLGRAGHYGEMAAAAKLVYLAFINVVGRQPMVAPFGGAEARLSTNPICFAMPMAAGRAPLLLDYATSGIAANKARLMAAGGEALAPGLMIDARGLPTTDPHALQASPPGALLPFGGHKGYALGVMAELLAGVMSGGATIAPRNARDGALRNNLFAVLFDPTRMGSSEWQLDEGAAFADYLVGCPAAPDVDRVLMPGEPEAMAQLRTLQTLQMSEAAWLLFADCARHCGLDPSSCRIDGA